MLRLTLLIACLAGLLCAIAAKATGRHGRLACPASPGRRVSQIATAIFLPRPDAKALGESLDPTLKLWATASAWEASASGGQRPALSGLHFTKFLLIQR
jgi:hypothetical protein